MPKHGENIRKRKDGRWEARYIRNYTEDGKAKYCSIYGKGYYEVKKRLGEIKEYEKNTITIPVKDIRFREALVLWLSNNKIKLRAQTYAKYLHLIEKHIVPCIGNEKTSRIDTLTINKFLEQKSENGRLDGKGGLSSNSIKMIIFIVRSTISFAAAEGLRKPLNGEINRPAKKNKELEVLNLREQRILEKYMRIHPDTTKLGILICLQMGLRIGEICGLRWEDINFEDGIVHIRRTVTRVHNINAKTESQSPKTVLKVDIPKTPTSNRIIPIPNYLMPLIKTFHKNSSSLYVIKGGAHEYLDPRTYQYKFQKYLKECKIRTVNFHALRHTFATRCIEVGMDIKSLSEILGHASVNITLNTYVHSSIEKKRNQLELLNSY